MVEPPVRQVIDAYVTSDFFKSDPVSPEELNDAEQRLKVVFPADLRAVASVFGGRNFGYISQNLLGSVDSPESITQRTITLRNAVGMPNSLVCLAELDEGIIVLETQLAPELPTLIYWFGVSAYSAFAVGEFPGYIYRTFQSYTEYFQFLFEQERLYRQMIAE